MRSLQDIFHPGEIMAQNQFNVGMKWNNNSLLGLNRLFQQAINDETAYYLESFKFFFISTANKTGECDCSFRGTEIDESGQLLKSVYVANSTTLIFPDYSGNNLYNSIGNMLVNPHIGLLFIDLKNASRLRVNGQAKIIEDKKTYLDIWPKALRYVEVSVKHVYINCSKRIKESTQI